MLVLAAFLPLTQPLLAQNHERLIRRFSYESGLTAPPVYTLAHDSAGFLWIGGRGGLYRYDGSVFRRWAPETIRDAVASIAVSPSGAVVALEERGRAYETSDAGVHELPLPPRCAEARYPRAAFAGDGTLWIACGEELSRRAPDGAWRSLPPAALDGERPRFVRPNPEGGIDVVTVAGLWRVQRDGTTRRLRTHTGIADVLSLPGGRLLVLDGGGNLIELYGGSERDLLSHSALPPARAIALAERSGAIWISFDHYLVSLRPGEAPEILRAEDGIRPGGPVLVDHEGSLWVGAPYALYQLPEPETRIWGERSGAARREPRFLARSGDVIWITTWGPTGYLHRAAQGWRAVSDLPWESRALICTGAGGQLWFTSDEGLLEVRGSAVVGRDAQLPLSFMHGCARGPGDALWLATSQGLLYAEPDGGLPRPVDLLSLRPAGATISAVLHTRDGRLWVAWENTFCHGSAAHVLEGRESSWVCQEVPDVLQVTSLVELPGGGVWASTYGAGVLSFRDGRWQPLGINAEFPSLAVHHLVPSARGGVWILGHGMALRVHERPVSPTGVEVVERLSLWHGLPTIGGGHLLEEEDGGLWITTASGVVQLPAAARFAAPAPPPVRLVEGRVDDRPLPLDGPVRLPYRQNRIELRFAALSYRDPTLLRYQVRLTPDAPWEDVRGAPSFRWAELRAGRYTAEVRASLDGIHWSAEPARLEFIVLRPWYAEPWALVLFLLGGVLLLWLGYRARLAYLLGLERQRTRIAMDLHDELGSALGSIALLSGVISADGMREAERRRMAREIAETAEELGSALSDIVWSLQPEAATIEELASRLAEHGARLFPGEEVEFTAELPERWPAAPLPLPVLRNVLLIGVEALHNAARHAGASQVVLSLTPLARGWELMVSDDGRGLGNGGSGNRLRGRGLAGMRRRAEEIGAALEITSPPEVGTTVRLRFPVHLPGSRAAARLRERLREVASRAGIA